MGLIEKQAACHLFCLHAGNGARRLVCQRPYHVERTRSRQLPEVKLRRVPLVLGWVTAWEYGMLLASLFLKQKMLPVPSSALEVQII